jgi:hypothetical protein
MGITFTFSASNLIRLVKFFFKKLETVVIYLALLKTREAKLEKIFDFSKIRISVPCAVIINGFLVKRETKYPINPPGIHH